MSDAWRTGQERIEDELPLVRTLPGSNWPVGNSSKTLEMSLNIGMSSSICSSPIGSSSPLWPMIVACSRYLRQHRCAMRVPSVGRGGVGCQRKWGASARGGASAQPIFEHDRVAARRRTEHCQVGLGPLTLRQGEDSDLPANVHHFSAAVSEERFDDAFERSRARTTNRRLGAASAT